ncbi:MAG: cell division protein ZapA [Desulfobacterales bacterium]|nr:MAG: cell division protein ZapA [Desulfobacterales bacterium]
MEQLVTIELFGQAYTFKADAEDTKAEDIADFLVREVARVENQQSGQSSKITKFAILILAALNIANENVELKKRHSKFIKEISERSANLLRTLEDSLK